MERRTQHFVMMGVIDGVTSIGVASDIDGYNAKIGIAYVF